VNDRCLPLARVVAAAAHGDAAGVAAGTHAALAAGATPAEVREALRMVHLFAGFPRALDAAAAAAPVLGPPPAAATGPDDDASLAAERRTFRDRGRALFDRVYGLDAARVHARLVALDPELTEWVLEDAYGRVLARSELPPSERERLATVLLAAQGLRNQLAGHVRGALRCGATREEVEASLGAAAAWIAEADLAAARDALERGTDSGPPPR
jgi:4-carboxymuconolactone decarboxylase